jgi:hypothetical protein
LWLREEIVRIVVPPVTPVAFLLSIFACVTNTGLPIHFSAVASLATVFVMDKVAFAYWLIAFRQWDSRRRARKESSTLH